MGNGLAVNPESIREQIIYPVVREFAQTSLEPGRLKCEPGLKLFGSEGALDSIGFVSFILAVEAKAEEVMKVPVRLLDDRALSQTKNPFSTVDGLTSYILALTSSENES